MGWGFPSINLPSVSDIVDPIAQLVGGPAATRVGNSIDDTAAAHLNPANSVGNAWNWLTSGLRPPDQPTLQDPTKLPAPTQADATTTAINQQLQDERQKYQASTYLTGGQGLLDEPMTASQHLLGV